MEGELADSAAREGVSMLIPEADPIAWSNADCESQIADLTLGICAI
jgi:hypothetical protein